MKTEKQKVNEELNRLRKFGYKVHHFSDKKKVVTKDWVDHVVHNHRFFLCIEDKFEATKDKLSEGQKETLVKLSSVAVFNKNFDYKGIGGVDDAKRIVENLLKGRL
jgi:hypothetical protein